MKTKPTPKIANLIAMSIPMTDEECERQQASLTRGARSGGRPVCRVEVFLDGALIGEGEVQFAETKEEA